MAPSYQQRQGYYKRLWDSLEIDTDAALVKSVAKKLLAAKSRYKAVGDKLSIPWEVIAVIHQRESSQNWSRSLAQGDPWNKVSTHVPKGRGPFNSWEEAAVDALKLRGMEKVKTWPIERILYELEGYNGFGYANRGVPSPYLWAKTNHYKDNPQDKDTPGGKYVADGKYDPNAYDKQIGCAALLKELYTLQSGNTKTAVAATAVAAATTAVVQPNYALYIAGVAVLIFLGIVIYRALYRG